MFTDIFRLKDLSLMYTFVDSMQPVFPIHRNERFDGSFQKLLNDLDIQWAIIWKFKFWTYTMNLSHLSFKLALEIGEFGLKMEWEYITKSNNICCYQNTPKNGHVWVKSHIWPFLWVKHHTTWYNIYRLLIWVITGL